MKYKNIEAVEKAIDKIGLSNIARIMTKKKGQVFSPQVINNWRHRGVPYKWLDLFAKITGAKKSELRND